MGSRGVLFAITERDAKRLIATDDGDAVMEIIEEIEESWDESNLAETDKAWDAMHRALTDGQLEWANGSYPLNHVILGGQSVYPDDDYIAVLKTPEQVRAVAAALESVDDARMGALYDSVVPADYDPSYGPDDREYTVGWFEGVRDLFATAAKSGRWVLFTADQ